MKSVRALNRSKSPGSEGDEITKQTLGPTLFSPNKSVSKRNKRVSERSGYESKFGQMDQKFNMKELTTGYPFMKDDQSENASSFKGSYVFKNNEDRKEIMNS